MLSRDLGDGAELRPLEPWQAAEFAAFVDEAREILAPYLPWASTVVDEESAREWLRSFADEQARDGRRILGIYLDGTLVGGITVVVFDKVRSICELGVWLTPSAQGRGLVTRASRVLIDWAVRVRGMARIEWRASADNERSLAVPKRLGMTYEGTLRSAFPCNGVRQDIEVWSLLADEWTG
ncbi:GNAT family N-acetyltransferase [Amycolatopsis suaedae]|uniref:N-acetyltransferase n=1 Tax=Amycolatopsis suaedae TaxID=2510978 RepID=A0A4Q7JCM0_9PSEU|nr:GNAT family protein [Amycolatopsis suaedae]RZQ65079.1 N-acetyltransferase [Amycolatopsis suaedae]